MMNLVYVVGIPSWTCCWDLSWWRVVGSSLHLGGRWHVTSTIVTLPISSMQLTFFVMVINRGSLRLLVWCFLLTPSQSRLTFSYFFHFNGHTWSEYMYRFLFSFTFWLNVFWVIKKPGWLEWCWCSHQLQVILKLLDQKN